MGRRKMVSLQVVPGGKDESKGAVQVVVSEREWEGAYVEAPDVEAVARELIQQVPAHRHLAEAKMRFIFRRGEWVSKGKDVLGKAVVLSERERFLSGGTELLVIISELWWRTALTRAEACPGRP